MTPAAASRRAASAPSARWVPGALLVVFAAGYYLYADLPLGGSLRLPAAGAVIGGLGLLAWHLGRLRYGDLWFAGAVTAITLASLVLNPAFYEDPALRRYAVDYATSYLVFLASLPMALGVVAGLRLLPASAIARGGLVTAIAILAGVLAERYGGLDALSDRVRASLFPPELIYAENLRDQLMYGAVRPKLFTSEPSHVAKAYVLALLVWYVAAAKRWRIPALYAFVAAGVILIKSPGVLVVLPAIWIADCCKLRRSRWLVTLLVGGVFLSPVAWLAAEWAFSDRLAHIASGRDGSFIIRIALPWEVLGQVWAEHPLFGLGFGAKESGIPYAIAAAHTMALDAGLLLQTTAPLGNNGLLIGLIQLGVLGSLLFGLTLVAFWRFACGAYWPFAAVALASYLVLIGGINDPRFWGGFALISAAAAAAVRRDGPQAQRTPLGPV